MGLSRIKIAFGLSLLLSLAGATLALAGDTLPGGLLAWSSSATRNRLLTENRLQFVAQVNQSEDNPVGRNLFKLREQLQSGSPSMEGLRKQFHYQGCLTCEPQSEVHRYGQSETQPGPQQRNQDCEDCIPAGDEHKYGQDDTQPGPQHRNQDCQDCVPQGDEHKYGQVENPPDPPHQNQDCQDCAPQGCENQNGQGNGQTGSPHH